MIRGEGLGKSFGRVEAIRGVDLHAPDGRITALLGPNGAGKSTTLRILATVLQADRGHAWVDGAEVSADPAAVRRSIGVLPHGAGLYARLSARENIAYFGALHGLGRAALRARVDELVEQLDMGEFANRRVAGFSQGQRIKVALARALVHDPKNVLLDEPTNGLDVMATRALREIIIALKRQGRCVVFSSHVMQEVATLCDDLIIVGGGQVRFAGSLDELRTRTGQDDLEDAFVDVVGEQPA
ncbi:MAG: ATP-binding cassette domain-containing protein [Gammaproteobacteria bacterium]|nr:ATP-binding cassette domain-containing protein [Gammaproteobacteria bacterium]